MKSKPNKKKILEESDSDDDVDFGFSTFSKQNEASDDLMDDTPVKSGINLDDFVDDDEAAAIQEAMKNSMKEHKRLKIKKAKKSSLETLEDNPPPKKKKKQEIVYLDDLEEDEPENASGDDGDEISVASHTSVDEEQQTAAQVLKEANALSAKIVKIIGQWTGQEEGLSSKGLILGEGALSLGGGGGPTQFTQAADDNEWISKETMKKILPTVELAEYQLLGVNWMALLNRLTFMKGKRGKKDDKMNVNGILADEMGLGKVRIS